MKNWLLLLLLWLPFGVLAAPERIAALSPSSIEMLFAIGAGDRIVATVAHADYPEAAKSIPRIGRYDKVDVEQLMLLQPDLIVVSVADTNPQQLQRLAMLQVPIIDSSTKSIRTLPQKLHELAELTGTAEQAAAKIAVLRGKIDTLIAGAEDVNVSVFYQVWPEPLTTVTKGWLADMIALCGGDNIFADAPSAYPQINPEQVIARAPQLILKPTHLEFANQERSSWSQWPEIPAVANKQIITVDGDLVHRFGPRAVDGMALVCAAMSRVAEGR